MLKKDIEKFWNKRSKCYEKLEWATQSGYLHAFLSAGEFIADDIVLYIGSGTGIVAHTVAPHTQEVIGIDISDDMLSHAFNHRTRNEKFIKMDATKLEFSDSYFSKVTARMVFHHILNDTQKAMDECYRILKKDGRMILSEGVPPSEHVKPFYVDMFKHKEDRITFMEHDLETLMVKAGFKNIKKIVHWNKSSSIKNWLNNSGLPHAVQRKIFNMHIELDEKGKRDYNMVISQADCLIDMKFIIMVGEK